MGSGLVLVPASGKGTFCTDTKLSSKQRDAACEHAAEAARQLTDGADVADSFLAGRLADGSALVVTPAAPRSIEGRLAATVEQRQLMESRSIRISAERVSDTRRISASQVHGKSGNGLSV